MTLIYFHGDRNKKEIALTFDDGPSKETDEILKILKKEKIPATFFICGKNINKNKNLIKQMIRQGCEVGNHTFSHKLLLLSSKKEILKEFNKTDFELKKLNIETNLIRPPHSWIGILGWLLLKKIKKRIVIGDVIAWDWEKNKSNERIEKIIKKTKNGSIIILHDYLEKNIGPNPIVVEITKGIIKPLKKRGFKFKTVSEIIK
jgi:peptidoglycan/xylan/chitin deacetylase (PgdA/CDA1 family)